MSLKDRVTKLEIALEAGGRLPLTNADAYAVTASDIADLRTNILHVASVAAAICQFGGIEKEAVWRWLDGVSTYPAIDAAHDLTEDLVERISEAIRRPVGSAS